MKNLSKTFVLMGCVALGIGLAPARADDQALIIANETYASAFSGASAQTVLQSSATLEDAGYRVVTHSNLTKDKLREAIAQFNQSAQAHDRLVYIISGHLLHKGDEAYLAPLDLKSPSADTIEAKAVPLSLILNKAANHAGGSAVILGDTRKKRSPFGRRHLAFEKAPGLQAGLGDPEIPQGVLVINGRANNVLDAINEQLFLPERNTHRALYNLGSLVRGQGYISRFSALHIPQDQRDTVEDEAYDPAFETAYWRYAKDEDTVEGYQDFMARYPNSERKDKAMNAITRLENAQAASIHEEAENAMKLTVLQKQLIQRSLTILKFDPKGIDGIIGPNTRGALGRWQKSNKQEATQYLTKPQMTTLLTQAKAESDRLIAEAKRKEAELAKADIAFWQETGKKGGEPELRAYLRKYPDGLRSEQARKKLANIEATKAKKADAKMLTAWNAAKDKDDAAAYTNFLKAYPNSVFEDDAKDRLADLGKREEMRAERAVAKSQEDSYNIPVKTWLLIESKLAESGQETGKVDGEVTSETRRSIRRFQRSIGLPGTGFMDQATFSQLVNS